MLAKIFYFIVIRNMTQTLTSSDHKANAQFSCRNGGYKLSKTGYFVPSKPGRLHNDLINNQKMKFLLLIFGTGKGFFRPTKS